jgi:hypothetical protein
VLAQPLPGPGNPGAAERLAVTRGACEAGIRLALAVVVPVGHGMVLARGQD